MSVWDVLNGANSIYQLSQKPSGGNGQGSFFQGLGNLATGNLDWERSQLQNQFNASEAQKSRDWQEYMSSTAYQRSREDMLKAGLNPALMFGSGQPSSTPSGATAHSAGNVHSGQALGSLMGSLLGAGLGLIKHSADLDFKNKQLGLHNQFLNSSLQLSKRGYTDYYSDSQGDYMYARSRRYD